jgi:uncharacterized membrane protein
MSFNLFLLVISAAVFHALWNFVARRASGNLAVFWWAIWVSCVMLLPFIINIAIQMGPDAFLRMLAAGYGHILATGVIHALYFLLLGRAYEHGEISVIYPVARGSGIGITAFLGWQMLDEQVTQAGFIGIILISLGILSMGMTALRHKRQAKQSFISALGVGATIVGYSLVDKVGVGLVHPVVYIGGMFILTVLIVTPVVTSRFRGQLLGTAKRAWRSILLIGIGSAGTYLMILFALKNGPVSYIVALREFAVVVGALLGVIFLKERLTPGKIGAILAILIGLICIKMG